LLKTKKYKIENIGCFGGFFKIFQGHLPIGKLDYSCQNRSPHFDGGFGVAAFLFAENLQAMNENPELHCNPIKKHH